MMDINELRNRINEIDEQLVGLFCDRLDTAKMIAEYKKENSLPVLDRERERAVLDRVSALAGKEKADYICSLYEKIFELSRSYQQKMLENEKTEGGK